MVTYHRPNDFLKSINSILENTRCPYHLSVIDNSSGQIDEYLSRFGNHEQITIYHNDTNIGKGASVNKWYNTIMKKNTLSHFVSIDSDIIVPKNWLLDMQRSFYALKRSTKVGMIAPAICHNKHETWSYQLQNRVVMHDTRKMSPAFDFYPGMYYNRHTAGPLFMIDTKFFESTGLFYDKQLYGADDGHLCATASRHKAFIGIDSNILVQHINEDSDQEYISWKFRNVTKDVDLCGRWD